MDGASSGVDGDGDGVLDDGDGDAERNDSSEDSDETSQALDAPSDDELRSVASDGFSAACLADPNEGNCCSAGQVVLTGTSGDDFWSFSSTASTARCVLGKGGHDDAYLSAGGDTVLFGSGDDYATAREGQNRLLGGAGNDILKSGNGADTLYGGDDDDDLYAGGGADWVDGGPGDDHLQGQDGNDVIVPGEGKDYVLAGNGNDTIVIRSTCEIEHDEYLSGGAGTDTLYAPLDAAGLTALGVDLWSIEHVVVIPPQPAACDACETTADCLGPKSECVATGAGFFTCHCPTGFQGEACDTCAPGYEGVNCETCVAGYRDLTELQTENDDGKDEPTFSRIRTRVCVPEEPSFCTSTPNDGGVSCGAGGACQVGEDGAFCACEDGYVGIACETCAAGYELDATGACVLGDACREAFCSSAGDCVAGTDGLLECVCDAGFSGGDCGDHLFRIEGLTDSVMVGPLDETTVRRLEFRRRDGTQPAETCSWSMLPGSLGTLASCPGDVRDASGDIVARCTSPCETLYVAPQTVGDEALVFDHVQVVVPGTSTADVAAIPLTPSIAMSGQIVEDLAPIYVNIIQFMRARGVRGASFALRRGDDNKTWGTARVTEVGFGTRDIGAVDETPSCTNPYRLAECPVPGSVDAWRVRPETPFRLASVSKPLTAAAIWDRFGQTWIDAPGVPMELWEAYFPDLVDFNYNRVNVAPAGAPPEYPIDPRFYDISLANLLTHRSGLCRSEGQTPGFEGNTLLPPIVPTNGFYPSPLGGGTINVRAGADPDNDQTVIDPHNGREVLTARLVALNDITQTCFTGAFGKFTWECLEEAVWDHDKVAELLFGTTLVYDPGEALTGSDGTEQCDDPYSNTAYAFLGHALAASYGDVYDREAPGQPLVWGTSGARVLQYVAPWLLQNGIFTEELYATEPKIVTGSTTDSSQEPAYRDLGNNSGRRIMSSELVTSYRTLWSPFFERWQFCSVDDPSLCSYGGNLNPPEEYFDEDVRNTPRAHAQGANYATAAGFAATARALLTFGVHHVMTAGTPLGTWGVGTGKRRPTVAAPDTHFSHGGSLWGTRAFYSHLASGVEVAGIRLPFFGGTLSNAWEIQGPVLGGVATPTQAFRAPWSDTCPPPPSGGLGTPGGTGPTTPCCRLAQDVDFVILLNQNADPTAQASSYGSNMLSLIEDGICQVEANNAWPNVPTSPSIPWAP